MIIAGLENKRILLLKNLKKPSYHSLPAKNHILTRITSLLPEKGRVYIGGDFQLGFFDIKKSRFKELKSKEFRSLLTFIKDLEFDSEGKILIGATSGAGIYDLIKKKITDSIWNIRTTAVYQVKGKGIYLGTINGLYFRKEGEVNVNRYVSNQLLNNARITDIRADNKNRLWIGTAQYGVFIVVENKILHLDDDISKEAYLSSYYVKQIYFDNKNRTWICTENGLNKIELSNQNKFKVEHINVVSGLANNNVNACTVLNDTLYLATLQGVSRLIYEPSVAKETPKLEITQTYVNNNIAELTNGIRLKFNKNSISIEFTAIAFQSPQDIEYHYRLFGASETWTITKNKRVDLLSLKPGDYKFEIYARNTTTLKKSNIQSLTFTVLQPWYSTWWFCLLCFTLIVSLVYLLIKRRINTVKKRSAELNKINKTFAELEMQALRAQMNPHFIFNAMTAIQHYFVSNDEIKANAYMSRFAQLIRRMLDYSSNNFIPLNEEIDLLKNYLDLEAMRFDHKISYTIGTDEELNPSEYKLPSLMLQPIIENAVNHGLRMAGMAGEIKLNFELKDNFLLCNITDNGVGIKYAISHKNQQLH
ncbi:MAG TPA: histidine kinase, partial [Bacteroidia bacterium]